jgi:adenylate cyclase
MGTAVILASKIGYNTLERSFELVLPNDVIMSANPQTALVDETQDPDGTTRRYYAFNMLRDDPNTWYLTIAMRSAEEFLNFPDSLRLEGDSEKGVIWLEDIEIPIYTKTSTFYVNYYGPPSAAQTGENDRWGTFDSYSLFQVVDVADVDLRDFDADIDWMDMFIDTTHWAYDIPGMGGLEESPFLDKVVLIGVSVEVFHDTKRTPYFSFAGEQKLMPGVEVHANALQTIIDQNFISMYGGDMEWSDKSWISHVILIAILAFIAYILLAFMNPLFAGLSILVELLIFISIAVGSFTNDSLWLVKLVFGSWDSIDVPGMGESTYIPVVASVFGVFTTYITNVLYRYIVEQKDKKFLKSTFGTYVSPELIDRMYEEHQEPKLGGEAGYHTAFFSDIQSFSSFTEVMEPQRMVALMNEYLTEMTDILLARHGTLDKYIGDAIVAFYGAPVPVEDHEYQACLTALEMETGIAKLREKWASEEDWPDLVHNLRHRVGLSTGDMVTGNMGSNMRMNYTMMGDTVNTAARLEASAKQYGVYIQVSEFTYEPVKDKFEWRTLDYVRVKGKTVPVRTYELLAEKGKLAEGESKLIDTFHEGLELYYSQKWDKALKAFKNADELEDMFPMRPSNPSRVYIERCKYLKENPPGTDWDKVWTLTQK